MNFPYHKYTGLLACKASLVSLATLALFGACETPNNEVFNDQTELTRFMDNDLDARELFESGLYPVEIILVDSGATLHEMISLSDSKRGSYQIRVGDSLTEIENFGKRLVARVSLSDNFMGVYSKRQGSNPELSKSWDGILSREALFLKLDGDAAPFLGWSFVGYNLGKPLHLIGSEVRIQVFPPFGGISRTISLKTVEDLPQSLREFTYLTHVDAVQSGERVEIETLRGKMSIFARTASGFRQLEPQPISAARYMYSYIVPTADPVNRFFHLLTLQSGPGLVIDSIYSRFLDTLRIDTLDPPDSLIDTTIFIDSSFIEVFLVDTVVYDTTVDPPDIQIDSQPNGLALVIDTVFFGVDTIVDTFIAHTQLDSTFSDTVHLFDKGDIWTFPYSVR